MANQDQKESVLLNLRSVTQSCKGGVPFERLQRDYQDLLGEPIPYRKLGYNTLEAFIRDIPEVITLKKNHDGHLMAEGVADASTAHIVSLVSRQKSETKKRNFRKPSSYRGMRRPLSSRYTFREGPRSAHSHFISSSHPPPPPPPPPKSPKYKPPSKPPVVEQHSKPRASNDQVPRSKYEIAPRFLKLQNQSRNNATQELISSPTHSSLPPPSLDNGSVIPPPRASTRPLPCKPLYVDNSRAAQLDSLECAGSAKEFVAIYAKMNKLEAKYDSKLMGQKAKNKAYVCTLMLGGKKYLSYPELRPTRELAEEEAAKNAMASIKESKEHMTMFPETPYSNTDEIRILLNKIEEIVCEKPSGMFANGIVREYENKHNEILPSCWPDLLKQSCCVEIDEIDLVYGSVPEGANFIVRPTKELSSGNRTPSSTSSKTDFVYEDLDTKSLKKSLVNISAVKVPEYKIPNGNMWDVYITNVNGWFSARLLDFYDEFLALSEEMGEFYETRSFPVVDVYEYQVYAACVDENSDIWHRVLVEEVKDDGQISCYFVDEGDFTSVRKENLQEMNPSFLKLPYQAIQISLDGLEEYENCIKYELLEKHVLGQTLIAEVKRWYPLLDFFPDVPGIHRTVYSVILYDTSDSSGEDLNLNEWLKTSVKESLICKLPKLLASSCAYLSHVTADGHVYIRFTNPQQCWIEQELEKFSPAFEEASAALTEIPLNTVCAAKYESGTWHRAVVSENGSVDPELVEVFFVDYGHLGVVGKSEICELEPISDLLASAPYQAVCCELLNALPTPTSQWTEAAIAKLFELAPFDQELIVRVMNEEEGNTLAKVNLYKRNKDNNIISINDSLACNPSLFKDASAPIKTPSALPLYKLTRKSSLKNNLSNAIPDVAVPAEEQMAKRLVASMSNEKIEWLNTPDNIKSPEAFDVLSPVTLQLPAIPDIGEYFDVFITMAAHPHNFVVQPLDSCVELNNLTKDMQSFYSCEENLLEMDFSMLRKNEYYAALHSDSTWYRVRIEEIISGNPVMVAAHYVDFGDFNTVSINKLQPLYQKFKHLSCQAVKASLAGIKPYETDWDPVHCVKFQEMVKEKTFVSRIYKKEIQLKNDIPELKVELILVDTSDSSKDVYIDNLLVEKLMAVRL